MLNFTEKISTGDAQTVKFIKDVSLKFKVSRYTVQACIPEYDTNVEFTICSVIHIIVWFERAEWLLALLMLTNTHTHTHTHTVVA